MVTTALTPVIEVTNATLRFPGDIALDNVSFRMFPGEVHSLMGENGAGKSTLIKAMTGALRLDSGTMLLSGTKVQFGSPAEAQAAGISTVYQEVDLLPNLTVAENLMLGREPRHRGGIDWRTMRERAHDVLLDLGLDIDPRSLLSSHSLAVQQIVAIGRAISADLKVLVLDEPTSSLDHDEVTELFRVIRELKDRGVAILFVSHFLDQVYEICDRVTVLRNGALVGEYLTRELLRIDLVQKMLGRKVQPIQPRAPVKDEVDERVPYLTATGVSQRNGIAPTDIDLYPGEVLGLAGLLGSGRTELARLVSGGDVPDTGAITVEGKHTSLRTPRAALALRIAYSSENRKTEGIIGELTVGENITLALQAQRGWFRRMRRTRQRELAASWIEALDIRPVDPDRPAGVLSGGNQQKVLLARLLALAPRLIVLDEPTRGIDVGAKVEIQNQVTSLAENGMAVVYISAELEEVLRVSHRVAILRDREVVSVLPADALTVDMLLAIVAQGDSDG
jgi:galactofuranose transport system ATP-binding protein